MPLNCMAAVTVCSDFEAQENKICHCSTFSTSICHEVMRAEKFKITLKNI